MARHKGDIPLASIKVHQKAEAFMRVMVAAHAMNRQLFDGQGTIGPLVEKESVAPYAPCAELSVRIDADEQGMAICGMVLTLPGSEFEPVSLMTILRGCIPTVSRI